MYLSRDARQCAAIGVVKPAQVVKSAGPLFFSATRPLICFFYKVHQYACGSVILANLAVYPRQ